MRRAVLLALTVLVLAPAGARTATWFRSPADGVMRAACCCPTEAGHHRQPALTSELRAACCCTILQLAAREAPERAHPPAAAVIAPPGLPAQTATPPPRDAAPIIAFDRPRATRGPPDLFVRHCALLL